MDNQPKKKGKSSLLSHDMSHDPDMQLLLQLLIEDYREREQVDPEDPAEVYKQRICSKIHDNVERFRARFLKGYEVLIDELNQEIKRE